MEKNSFTNISSSAMNWHSLSPVPEQTHDCFFNTVYDPMKGHFSNEKISSFGQSMLANPSLSSVATDPGFAERAARFSSLGSRSFNERKNNELVKKLNFDQNLRNLRLSRVSSTPLLTTNKGSNGLGVKFGEMGSSDSSSVSEQMVEEKSPSGSSSRRIKSGLKGNSQKVEDEQNVRDLKRCKTREKKGSDNNTSKKEEIDENQNDKHEPLKDYIHVRARRGQATDSHSLAERVRREKISERMKFLQDLVPGCNKVTGKAVMLDEIINYVQALQRQVEFLSMKLASVEALDFNIDCFLSKDVTNSTYSADSSFLFGQRKQELNQQKAEFSNGLITHCSMEPSDATMYRDFSLQLQCADEIGQGFPQFLGSYEDDLHSIVQMGFGQNSSDKTGLHLQTVPGSGDAHTTPHMSIEL